MRRTIKILYDCATPKALASLRYPSLFALIYTDETKPLVRAVLRLRAKIRDHRRTLRLIADAPNRTKRLSNGMRVVIGIIPNETKRILNMLRTKRDYRIVAKTRKAFESKTPRTAANHIGVEIECFTPGTSHNALAKAFARADLERFVKVTSDGSLSNSEDGECYCRDNCDGSCYECECSTCDGDCVNDTCEGAASNCRLVDCDCDTSDGAECAGHSCPGGHTSRDCPGDHDCHGEHECNCPCNCETDGVEVPVLATEKNFRRVVSDVCRVLADHDATVNSTCGLHVHLDMRNRDVTRAYRQLVLAQPLLMSLVPPSRRRNRFCKLNTTPLFKNASDDRYYTVNACAYREHETLEVRLHTGTVNAEKINAWITLLLTIIDGRRLTRPLRSLADAHALFRFDAHLLAYLRERQAKFGEAYSETSKRIEHAASIAA